MQFNEVSNGSLFKTSALAGYKLNEVDRDCNLVLCRRVDLFISREEIFDGKVQFLSATGFARIGEACVHKLLAYESQRSINNAVMHWISFSELPRPDPCRKCHNGLRPEQALSATVLRGCIRGIGGGCEVG